MAGRPDAEIVALGRGLHAASPSAARHPLRALDERAMDLAARDPELRAALFRLVDVAPACRWPTSSPRTSPGSSARSTTVRRHHLALRMGATRAGRRALGGAVGGRACARGAPVHRRESRGARRRHAAAGMWSDGASRASVDLLGEATVTAAEAERTPRAARRRSRPSPRSTARWPRRPGAGGRRASARSRAPTSP